MKKYYDNTEKKPPNKNLIWFMNKIKQTPGEAVELGCGAGRDTRYLIKNGWKVLAIDKNDVEERISKKFTLEELKNFVFSRQRFEEIKLKENDLVVANFSLSFCERTKFNDLWAKIEKSIRSNRIFCR